MQKMIILIGIILTVVLIIVVHYFYFNIYETKAEINLIKDVGNRRVYEVQFKLLNSLGMNIPFRKAEPKIEIIEGNKFVSKIENGFIEVFPTKSEKIVIKIMSKYSIAEEILTINF